MRLRTVVLAWASIILLFEFRHFLMNLLMVEKTCDLKERMVPRITPIRIAATLRMDCPGQIMLLYIITDLFGNSCIDNVIAVYAVIEVYAFIQHL